MGADLGNARGPVTKIGQGMGPPALPGPSNSAHCRADSFKLGSGVVSTRLVASFAFWCLAARGCLGFGVPTSWRRSEDSEES